MIVHLKDGTQEFIHNPDKFMDLVRDRLGDEAANYLKNYIEKLSDASPNDELIQALRDLIEEWE